MLWHGCKGSESLLPFRVVLKNGPCHVSCINPDLTLETPLTIQIHNMMEYCSVAYAWIGRGWTQEIHWIRVQGKEFIEWKGKYWTDFLNHMAQKKWELVAVAPLDSGGSRVYGVVAYFKRLI
jgi:hypothetical protein